MTRTLAGARIVIARVRDRGAELGQRIAAAGGEAFHFPVIDIQPLPGVPLPANIPDWLIFTSVAAVEHGLRRVLPRREAGTRIAAIGDATAQALRAAGAPADLVPERQESEGLLERPEFAGIAGKHVWILRGRDGRELLVDSLRARGGIVDCLETYERKVPGDSIEPLLERWRSGRIDALVITSAAGLSNLHAMLDAAGRGFLGQTQLVVPTARMLKLAHEFDIRVAPIVATGASDDALLTALVNWWRDGRQES